MIPYPRRVRNSCIYSIAVLAKGSIFSLARLKSHYPFYWVPPGGLTELLSTLPSLTSSVIGSTLPEEKLSLHSSVCYSQAPEDFRGNAGSRGNGARQVLRWGAKRRGTIYGGCSLLINQWRNERENLREGIWSKGEYQGRKDTVEDGYGRHTA